MGFFDFFSNVSETKELHSDIKLRTRYYRTNFKKTLVVVEDFAAQNGYVVKSIDEKYGEIFLQSQKAHMIISISQMNMLETAVDVKVELYGVIGANRPKNMIVKLYNLLDHNLEFKGTSLNP